MDMRNKKARVSQMVRTVLLAVSLCACASVSASGTSAVSTGKVHVRLDEYELSFDLPALKPSKDFPPVQIEHQTNLSLIKRPHVILRGFWEGVRTNPMWANGLLDLSLDVSPWPESAASASDCHEKTRLVIQQIVDDRRRRTEQRGGVARKPEIFETTIAGQNAIRLRGIYEDSMERYAIPLDDRFYLTVIVSMADGDGSNAWLPRAAAERDRFLRSLELSARTCQQSNGGP